MSLLMENSLKMVIQDMLQQSTTNNQHSSLTTNKIIVIDLVDADQ